MGYSKCICLFLMSLLPLAMTVGCSLKAIATSAPAAISPVGASAPNVGSTYWTAPSVGSMNALGELSISDKAAGSTKYLSPTITGAGGDLICTAADWNASGTILIISYTLTARIIHVTLIPTATAKGVQVQLDADAGLIANVDMGQWSGNLNARSIPVPYYSQNVWFSTTISQYINSWWDWKNTHSTRQLGTSASYWAKTDGTLNLLHETITLSLSPNIDDVLPTIGNPASPHHADLAGKLILDIWDMGLPAIQQGLADLGDYGVGNCAAIVHVWQHEGYDNALPEHYTANYDLGGDNAMKALVAQGTSNGCLMALHENYIDYYPNYPAFDPTALGVAGDGTTLTSWYNPTTQIQSFQAKPSLMVQIAKGQSPVIHQLYGTSASFLDVNSAVGVDFKRDMDSALADAGSTAIWWKGAAALWQYERQTHGGPVFGEGLNHWYYSGLLDGVEAQLGAGGVAMNLDKTLPLFADFDLLQIHPLQVNHGMGYYFRWTSDGTVNMSVAQMDAYRTQEIAFGHAPFLSHVTWSDISRAFVESNLVSSVATAYGNAQAVGIKYGSADLSGQQTWVSSAVAEQTSGFSQISVSYDSGLSIVANSNSSSLNWNGIVVPQYGWAAKSKSLLAYTALCGTVICDYAATPTSVFANARNQQDARNGWGAARPSITRARQGMNSLVFNYQWQVLHNPSTEIPYTVFVQFVDDAQFSSTNEAIVCQEKHQPQTPTTAWQAPQMLEDDDHTIFIPSTVADGTYSVRMGLYDPVTGNRATLAGVSDGNSRYIVGFVTISGGGLHVSFTPPPALPNDPRLNAENAVLDFGNVKTNGMVSIKQENGRWILRPFPRYDAFNVLLRADDFPEPSLIQEDNGTSNVTVAPVRNGEYWQLPLDGSKSYSWPVH